MDEYWRLLRITAWIPVTVILVCLGWWLFRIVMKMHYDSHSDESLGFEDVLQEELDNLKNFIGTWWTWACRSYIALINLMFSSEFLFRMKPFRYCRGPAAVFCKVFLVIFDFLLVASCVSFYVLFNRYNKGFEEQRGTISLELNIWLVASFLLPLLGSI